MTDPRREILESIQKYVDRANEVLPEGSRPADRKRILAEVQQQSIDVIRTKGRGLPRQPSAGSYERLAWDILARYNELLDVLDDDLADRGRWGVAVLHFMEAVNEASPPTHLEPDYILGKQSNKNLEKMRQRKKTDNELRIEIQHGKVIEMVQEKLRECMMKNMRPRMTQLYNEVASDKEHFDYTLRNVQKVWNEYINPKDKHSSLYAWKEK